MSSVVLRGRGSDRVRPPPTRAIGPRSCFVIPDEIGFSPMPFASITAPTTRSRCSCTSWRSCWPSARPSATASASRSLPQYPRSAPAILAGDPEDRPLPGQPGMIVILLAGIYLMIASDDAWKRRRGLHHRRLPRDHRPLRPPARLLPAPGRAGASELAERDLRLATRSARVRRDPERPAKSAGSPA